MIATNDLTKIRQSILEGWEVVAAEYTKGWLEIFARYAGRLLDLLQPPIGSTSGVEAAWSHCKLQHGQVLLSG